ncbi:OPT family small oligopeptide transporter [Cokeromyces recurvatus]|uniref:OPT family small oligopeptide transporter n=1 Tax=Cokeromyces recurvatus TaxID=90255 RepID=UPI00222082CA|nr:OPT family small oligopeptide transporter [Cokeromyces recurvatus]KAI7901668.1 OPT family small oligopeptide transporter [Cokeromyces recurvatus]
MESKTSIHSSHSSRMEEKVEQMSAFDEKKAGSYYDDEKIVGDITTDTFQNEDSPIEEVRAVVPNTDDPTLPIYTFRMWCLGLVFSCVLAFVNQFFWYRRNAMTLSPLVVQLISFPIGKFMEKVIPKSRFFNPGPFNMKEHVLITVMANCSYGTAYAIDIITIQNLWYGQDMGWGGDILLIWTTQLIGFGMAGVLRPYLVYPSAMVWPSNLANISLFRSFHIADGEWTGVPRYKYFLYCFCAMFVYYWLPGYFFQVLTFFSWACWIKPSNRVLSQLTGGLEGLGLLAISFDWSTIVSFLGSPFVVPWWAIANIAVGAALVSWVIVPALYYTNTWNSKNFPIITSALFTSDGGAWNNSIVLNADKTLNHEAYDEYGPLYMTSFFAFTYGIMFAGVTSILTHTFLYHGKDIIRQFKASRTEDEDIHRKLMRAYPEVPFWWYAFIFFGSLGVSFGVIYGWPEIKLPWWGFLLAVAIPMIFTLPIGIIQAVTNQQPGLNIITELVIGYALPGRPIANVTFKTYGYISMAQCLTFVGDLKLGHYTKVPPRAMFWVQIVGTAIAGVINLATAKWLMATVENICTPEAYPFTCPSAHTFYSASIIWGTIGPGKMFGGVSPYASMNWFFLIGFLLPIPFWYLSKRYPNSLWKYVHLPLIFNATGMMPPAVPLNFSMWCALGFISMYWLRKYRHNWWIKYNYLTSAAFDSGCAIAALIIWGIVQGSGYTPNWWGNGGDVSFDHCPLSSSNGLD